MQYKTLELHVDNANATILLNRPDRLNSFDLNLGKELLEVLKISEADPAIRTVIIKGCGKGFCGGGDVKEMNTASDKADFMRELTQAIHRCVIQIRTMQKPVIAAVNGAAFGAGFSLVLACDLVIAVDDARFNSAFVNIGLAPGCGTHFMTRLFSYQKACELVLTAKTFTAKEALSLGFVNEVVTLEELDNAIKKYTLKFANLPPLAVGMAKMLLNESFHNDLISHLELESRTASQSATSQDFEEGIRAFVEKRKANFMGL
jgi:2-(1,2-epoxy-1,2-dihydrophenyl)acetyl-CoA isomerase